MISLAYAELAAIDETLARRMLLKAYHDLGGNVSQTAGSLSCSRNTVRKWVRRHFDRRFNGRTPFQRSDNFCPWITENFYLNPPLILDRGSAIHPLTGGHDLLAAFSDALHTTAANL